MIDKENLGLSPQEASPLKTIFHDIQKGGLDILPGFEEYLKKNMGLHYLRVRNTTLVLFEAEERVRENTLLNRQKITKSEYVQLSLGTYSWGKADETHGGISS